MKWIQRILKGLGYIAFFLACTLVFIRVGLDLERLRPQVNTLLSSMLSMEVKLIDLKWSGLTGIETSQISSIPT